MRDTQQVGRGIILAAAVLLVLFAGGFLLNVLRSDFGGFVTIMSALAFGAAILALVVSFNLYRRARTLS